MAADLGGPLEQLWGLITRGGGATMLRCAYQVDSRLTHYQAQEVSVHVNRRTYIATLMFQTMQIMHRRVNVQRST